MLKPNKRINMPCSDVNCQKRCQILYNLSDEDKKDLENGKLLFNIDVSLMCYCLDDDHCTFMFANESYDKRRRSGARTIDDTEHIAVVIQTDYMPLHAECWKCCQCRD